MSEIENLRTELEAMTKRVIMLEQFINSATRSEPAGTTTVGALTNISDTQLADNPLFYVEHADGGLNVYLSQIVAQAQKDIAAESITSGTLNTGRLPTIPVGKVPAAVNSATAGAGFGGFRYTVSGTTGNLFTS
ncbi:hypothetical protein AL471_014340 [Vibrio alginolyticus]|uniref:hypothetical protein n=1 Tax=Vibrio alginolyticus TaxID=663 RepID=UPI00076C621C|nr:hypothetical protein [Vibrio alginolyticus]PNP21951.1 hypothetical protein AL471_014340 [Vibrio alginolyticus]